MSKINIERKKMQVFFVDSEISINSNNVLTLLKIRSLFHVGIGNIFILWFVGYNLF